VGCDREVRVVLCVMDHGLDRLGERGHLSVPPRRPHLQHLLGECDFEEVSRPLEDDGPMPAAHRPGLRVDSRLTIPESELSWRFSRSSGPGGQGVNTADSRAELVWDVARSGVLSSLQRERLLERLSSRLVDGVLTITASEHRAQLRNRDAARARLAALVSDALRPPSPSRRPTKPSRGAKERRLEAKKRRTDVKRLRRPPHD
jgi:ribosome-associated protein